VSRAYRVTATLSRPLVAINTHAELPGLGPYTATDAALRRIPYSMPVLTRAVQQIKNCPKRFITPQKEYPAPPPFVRELPSALP
jgi:hypothetical protein